MNNGAIPMKESTKDEKKELKLPAGIDAEVKKDLLKSSADLRIDNVKMSDGIISAEICYSKDNDYVRKPKHFDTWKQFATYADKFFAIQDESKQDDM